MKRLLLFLWVVAGAAQAEPAGPPRLTGIVVTPERRIAIFGDAGGAIEWAEEGTLAFGYLVRSIRRDQTVLERDGRAIMLVPTPLGAPTGRLAPDTGGVTFGLVINPRRLAED